MKSDRDKIPDMRRPTLQIVFRGLLIAAVVVGGCSLVLRAAGVSISFGEPPEFGWTAYPILTVVHWAEPGGSLAPGKLPPKQMRRTRLGTVVIWADGTRTLYVHR